MPGAVALDVRHGPVTRVSVEWRCVAPCPTSTPVKNIHHRNAMRTIFLPPLPNRPCRENLWQRESTHRTFATLTRGKTSWVSRRAKQHLHHSFPDCGWGIFRSRIVEDTLLNPPNLSEVDFRIVMFFSPPHPSILLMSLLHRRETELDPITTGLQRNQSDTRKHNQFCIRSSLDSRTHAKKPRLCYKIERKV